MEKKPFFVHTPEREDGALRGALVLLWHGAGGDVDERSILTLARAFAREGAFAIRARFAYRVAGRRAPDRMPVLINAARNTIAEVRTLVGSCAKLILGGRSMGGRVASMLAAEGDPVDGLLFLAYPLHPEGQLDKMRDEHLYGLKCPMLFVQGDRDALAEKTRLDAVLSRLDARAHLASFAGADHSLRQAPIDRVVDESLTWARTTVFQR